MKKYLLIITLFTALVGCQKAKEAIAEDLIIKAMTDGQWKVTKFKKDSTDVTTDFASYKFQFKKDNSVDALNNAATEASGSWNADAMARTITSNFANGSNTIKLLNGTWKITNNSWTFVEATQTVNGEVRLLRLDK